MSTKTFPGDNNERLILFLVVSILLHFGVLGALMLFPKGLPSRGKAKAPVVVDVVDLPMPGPENISPVKKPPTHFADRDQSVIKETYPAPAIRGRAIILPKPQSPEIKKSAPKGAVSQKGHPAAKPLPSDTAINTQPKEALRAGETVTGKEDLKAPAAEATPGIKDEAASEQKAPPFKNAPPAKPNLFLSDERIAELSRKYEAEAPKGEVGKTLQLNTSELKYQKYLLNMKQKIELYWEYPDLAARNGWQGNLKINFRINKDGSVSDIELAKSSGYPMLDDAAITAIRLASPFPPFPENFEIADINIKGQFVYHIIVPRMR